VRSGSAEHFAPRLDRAPYRIGDAGELDQELVAGGLDDAVPYAL